MKELLASLAITLTVGAFANPLTNLDFDHISVGPTFGIDGGGGNAVVCRDQERNITSARLLDLYEGEVLHGLQYRALSTTADEKLEEIVSNIYGKEMGQGMFYLFKSIQNGFKPLPTGVTLKPINDSGHIFTPANCEIEQVANFYNMGNIYIVSDIYDKMSELDKLGLVLHETIFWLEREGQIKNSRYTRRVVAHLLSDGFTPEPIYSGVDKSKDYFCSTGDFISPVSNKSKNTTFWASPAGDGWKLTFDHLNGHKVYSNKSVYVNFASKTFPIFQDAEPNFVEHINIATQLESLIDPFDAISLVLSNDTMTIGGSTDQFMMIQWRGFDPGDESKFQQFHCTKIQVHF